MSVIRYRRCHRYIPKNIQPVRPKCNKLLVPSKKILLCIFSIVEEGFYSLHTGGSIRDQDILLWTILKNQKRSGDN